MRFFIFITIINLCLPCCVKITPFPFSLGRLKYSILVVIWFSSDLANTILVYRSIGRMLTPVSLSSTALPCAPCKYKRIKDYLYDMEAVLGSGNFSTVYRAVREGTGTALPIQTNPLR